MMTRDPKALRGGRSGAVAVGCLLLALAGCSLDKQTVPALSGPSELATSLKMQAIPDVLTADGLSTSAITVTAFDQNGRPRPGLPIFFAIADAQGNFAEIGTLNDLSGAQVFGAPGDKQGTAVVSTDGGGVARVIYKTPFRTDFTANQRILVMARPVGDNATGSIYRSVGLELRSAEPREYPQNAANCPSAGGAGCPRCNFVVEPSVGPYNAGQVISFQDASVDTPDSTGRTGVIVRYEWFFGDGSPTEYHPQEAHIYHSAGAYTTTHVVTDDNGGQSACAVQLLVN